GQLWCHLPDLTYAVPSFTRCRGSRLLETMEIPLGIHREKYQNVCVCRISHQRTHKKDMPGELTGDSSAQWSVLKPQAIPSIFQWASKKSADEQQTPE
uniref:Uncharacterized protein n=1 Tax=Esox lucius TaxID=8010 RepID=A0AAY5LBH2_ESOLU